MAKWFRSSSHWRQLPVEGCQDTTSLHLGLDEKPTNDMIDIGMVDIHRVGVIGAGQMGSGIAHVCALAGFDVALNDVSEERVKAGIATINGNLARQVVRQAISENERQAALGRIGAATNIETLSDCDLVIETAVEKEDVKRKI